MKRIIVATLTALMLTSSIAEAQSARRNCAERQNVVAKLEERYGESAQSIGLTARGQVVETWANLDSGTWTLTVTHPNGITCLIASGQAFENINQEVVQGGEM